MIPCVKIYRRKLYHWSSVEAELIKKQHLYAMIIHEMHLF
jgi:hypothetical protein